MVSGWRLIMPLHLKPLEVSSELDGCRSVLIVSCPICPPVSLATDRNMPFKEILKSGVKTGAYENLLREIRGSLERRGVRTDVFTSYLPCAAMCLWTRRQRDRLLRRATGYEAALVMGCESARHTVAETLENTDCKVVLGMGLVGITNATLSFRLPATVNLENPARVAANEHVADP
jgi:hypothetical protein